MLKIFLLILDKQNKQIVKDFSFTTVHLTASDTDHTHKSQFQVVDHIPNSHFIYQAITVELGATEIMH